MTLKTVPLLTQTACVDPDTTLSDTLRQMLARQTNHIPVCSDGVWVGLVDIRAILGELLPVSARIEHGLPDLGFVGDGLSLLATHFRALKTRTVRELDLPALPTLREDTPILEAALMLYREGSPLPVLDPAGRLKGMLSRRSLLAHLAARLGDA